MEPSSAKSPVCAACEKLRKRARVAVSDQESTSDKFAFLRISGEGYSFDMESGPADGGRKKRKSGPAAGKNLRWTDEASGFLIEYLADQIREGVEGNLHLAAAKAVNERFGSQFTDSHVYSHLRTWRNRWNRICRLKKLSDYVMWIPESRTIEMYDEAIYKAYVEKNKLDEPYLNKPIEHYDEMILVFRDESASGKYAQDDSQPLGESQDTNSAGSPPEAGKSSDHLVSMSVSQGSRGKGKRSNRQLEILDKFAESLKRIGDCMYERKEEEKRVVAECYDQLWSMVGSQCDHYIFTEEVVSAAYDFLIENPKLGAGFLRRTSEERVCWLYRFMKQHKLD